MTQLQLPLPPTKQEVGQRSYLSGLSAEDAVERHLERQGLVIVARRWRCKSGEIDLVALDGEVFVFIEVKKARSFEAAVQSLREAQMLRIHAAASEYLAKTPSGQLSEVRFDLALMDETGQMRILQGAFSHF